MVLSGIPNLDLLFEDDFGIAVCHRWDGKYIIHSEVYNQDYSLEDMKEVKKRSDAIDAAFKGKGVKEIYTWAETEEQKRYNSFLGYKPTGVIVNDSFVEKDYPYPVYEYKKELI